MNAVIYCDRTCGVSRSGHGHQQHLHPVPVGPSFFTTGASSASVDGTHVRAMRVSEEHHHTRRENPTAPRLAVWSASAKSWPKSAPGDVGGAKTGPALLAGAKHEQQDQQEQAQRRFHGELLLDAGGNDPPARGKQQRQIQDGVAEGFFASSSL